MNPPYVPTSSPPPELRAQALHLLSVCDPLAKSDGVRSLEESWGAGRMPLDADAHLTACCPIPGRPERPELVPPLSVEHCSMRTVEGRAAMIHALAHIEFNAINLALDAVWRFDGMPAEFYADWLRIAAEEAVHFSLLAAHLQTLGFAYGDFAAHNSL